MIGDERGFTLVETVVTVAIVAVLAAGVVWMLGMHPGALAQAADDYDAALASARANAMTSGNGATLVFAPRPNGAAGFTLRVYSGRPTAANAVQATTAMPVVSDASVAEKTLGAPPFAIFIGASGHVSGAPSYPSFAGGGAVFGAIATEPACPSGGFVLTFTGPQHATVTRTLPCTVAVAGAPELPNPSPTPNVPLVTPPSLVYHWPADARQTFVATEWGYTHWFVTTDGFGCGGTAVASFPDVLPAPYSRAYDAAEAAATPLPPAGTPYSYPNSGGASMNDAPARFPLDPAAEGLCAATVADDYGQRAHTDVQVMGWLTASYGSKEYRHFTTPILALPSSSFGKVGAAVTIPVSKTFDAEALSPRASFDATCAAYVTASASPGTTPSRPSRTPATASITLALATMPQSQITCGGTIYDQYPNSLAGEGVPFNLTIVPSQPTTWPPAVQYPYPGTAVGPCQINQPRAFTDGTFSHSDNGDTPPWNPNSAYTTGTAPNYGCMYFGGNPINDTATDPSGVSVLVNEAGYPGSSSFGLDNSVSGLPSCNSGNLLLTWQSATGPTGFMLAQGLNLQPTCYFALTDGTGAVTLGQNTVAAQVVGPCLSAADCFAELKGNWVTYYTCGGIVDGCETYHNVDLIIDSHDQGINWGLWQDRYAGRTKLTCNTPPDPYKPGFTGNTWTGIIASPPDNFSFVWSPTPTFGLPAGDPVSPPTPNCVYGVAGG